MARNAVTNDSIGYVLRYGESDFVADGEAPAGFSVVPLNDGVEPVESVLWHNGVSAGSFVALSGANQDAADADINSQAAIGEPGEVVEYDGLGAQQGGQVRPSEVTSIGVVGDPNNLVTVSSATEVKIEAHVAMFRQTASLTARVVRAAVPEFDSLAIPLNSSRWIGVDYNGGSIQAIVTTDEVGGFNLLTQYPLAYVARDANGIHITPVVIPLTDFNTLLLARLYQTNPIARGDGLLLGTSGTSSEKIKVSAGSMWLLLIQSQFFGPGPTYVDFDTNVSDTCEQYTGSTGSGFGVVENVVDYNDTQYNDGSPTPAALGGGRYGNLWFYMEPSTGSINYMLGTTNDKNLAVAEVEPPPSDLPPRLKNGSILIGRMIVQNGSGAQVIESAWNTAFAPSAVSSHSGLANLDADDHGQYALADGSRGFTNAGADTVIVLPIATTGANAGASSVRVGNRDPTGNVTADPGELYLRVNGTDSQLYIHKGSATNNTGWVAVGTGAGGGSPSASTVVTAPHRIRTIAAATPPLEEAGEATKIEVTFPTATDGAGGSFSFVFKIGDPAGSPTTIGTVTITQGNRTAEFTPGSPVAYAAGAELIIEQTAVGAFAATVPPEQRRATCVMRYNAT